MNRRISVRGIALHEGKLLCVKLLPYEGAIRGEYWCLPGGGLDPDESILEGVHREMLEETGIAPNIGNLMYVHQFKAGDTDNVEFFFHIRNGKDYLNVDLAKSTHGQAEIAEIAFLDAAKTHILPEFLSTEHLDPEAPTKVISYPEKS